MNLECISNSRWNDLISPRDAALQQLFEAVQDNSDRCLMMCLVQYELKAYISRVSHEKRNTINRYIGRYDAAQKFFLSTNLETLFAHLIEKKDPNVIRDLVAEYTDEFSLYHQVLHSCFQWRIFRSLGGSGTFQ